MPTQMVNLRLEEELIARLDAVVTRLQADNPKATVTRSSLIKGYIKEGLEKEVFNPMKFKHYTYGNNPESLPLDW